MPKLPCPCGELINLSPIPNRYGFRIIPEILMEKIAESLIELHKTAESDKLFERHSISQFGHRTNQGVMHIYECKACGRIALLARESDNMPAIWYKPEKFTDPTQGTSMNDIAVNLMNSDKSTKE